MIKICISGLSSSGKTTLGDILAAKWKINHINHSYKHYSKTNEELLEILKQSNKKFVKAFDKKIIDAAKKGDCIVTTWLGPWLIKNATLRIWLDGGIKERARRYALKSNVKLKDAEEFLKSKDLLTINEFKNVYNIDIMDHSFFDIIINTEKISTSNILNIIDLLAKRKTQKV